MASTSLLLLWRIATFAIVARQQELLKKSCWPDLRFHYANCCVEGVEPQSGCWDDGRSFEQCCRCAKGVNLTGNINLKLLQHFFGPLLCEAPSVKTREDDFLVSTDGGQQTRLLKVYIYKLHRRFNAELLNRLQLGGWATGTDCDYGLTPCTESTWNGLFSVNRQFATEVLTLLKFLAAPPGVLTENPHEADLFVVPYFAKTDCAESGNLGQDPCWGKCKCSTVVKHLFPSLKHYNWNNRGKHLFLGTGDAKDLPVEIQGQPLWLSLGASYCSGHIVVPSPNLDPVLQPSNLQRLESQRIPERHIFVYYFGSDHHKFRQLFLRQLAAYKRIPDAKLVVVHGIGSDYETRDLWQTDAGSPDMVIQEMRRSVFCPVVQGDVPHQKRLFDSIITGCIPVVISYPSHVKGVASWWLEGGPPIDRMVPFPDAIDYHDFVVEVPLQDAEDGRFLEALLKLSDDDIARRQRAMRKARSRLYFDFDGSVPDAFSSTLQAVWRFLQKQNGTFDCGVPPWLHSDGNLMYGHYACCLPGEAMTR